MNTKVKAHKEICEYLNNLYERKNHDYGDSFHQTFVEEGMAMARIRLGDKFSRFKTLTLNGSQQVQDESVRDTLLDLANYAIMTVMEMDNKEKRVADIKDEPIAGLANSDAVIKFSRSCGIPFASEIEATNVIAQMNGIIAKNGFASVADFMELAHRRVMPLDSEYGWTSPIEAAPKRCEPDSEYIIPFPRLERFEEPRIRVESRPN